jgi:hypothetical protein
MRRLLLLAALSLAHCGGDVAPDLKLVVASTIAADGTCGADASLSTLGAATVRLSARMHGPGGAMLSSALCDLVVPAGGAPTLALPLPAGGRVDLYAEAFSAAGAGAQRLATGALLGVDPRAAVPPLRLYAAESFRCFPGGALAQGRAFHSATALPDGTLLFVGGASPRGDGTNGPANALGDLYALASIEGYDPAAGHFFSVADAQPVARAFHSAALLPAAGDGKVRLLVVGGVGAMATAMPVLEANAGGDATLPRGFRWYTLPNAVAAPAEILVYDPVARAVVQHVAAGAPVAGHSAAFQAGAALPGGGLALAGGVFPSGAYDSQVGVTSDGMTAAASALDVPRLGASLVDAPDGSALLVGGLTDLTAGMPFGRVDLHAAAYAPAAATADSRALFPSYLFPTLVLLDPQPMLASRRVLVAGGLELRPGAGAPTATQPPTTTLQQLTWTAEMVQPGTPGTPLEVAQLAPSADWAFDPNCGARPHFKPVAFAAATLLPTGDRVLVTGGTPREIAMQCAECEGGDSSTTACALAQSAIVTVPPTGNGEVRYAAPLAVARFGHTQSLLADGTLLLVGGLTRRPGAPGGGYDSWAVAAAERFDPVRRVVPSWAPEGGTGPLEDPDDPLHADLAAAALSRVAGSTAFHTSDADHKPAIPCPTL